MSKGKQSDWALAQEIVRDVFGRGKTRYTKGDLGKTHNTESIWGNNSGKKKGHTTYHNSGGMHRHGSHAARGKKKDWI